MKQEIVNQANMICRLEWDISALGHNLVMCILAEYKKLGVKLEEQKPCFVKVPLAKLLSGQEGRDGGHQYAAAKKMVQNTVKASVVFDRQDAIFGMGIFENKAKYDKKTGEIECSLNPDLFQFWLELTGNYAQLRVDKVLQLPLNITAHLLYQCLMSHKFKKQCELDFDRFKTELGCSKMDNRDFTRRILVKYQKDFTENDILRWDYELVRGRFNKIVAIRLWFEPKPVKKPKQTQKKKKDWGWIEELYPEAIEMAHEVADSGKWKGALTLLDAIMLSTPPDIRADAITSFKAEVVARKHQQELF